MQPMTAPAPEEKTYTKIHSSKMVLWIAIVSMIMMFAGLTSAYIVRQAEGNWLVFELPRAFYFSTAFLLVSSLTMHYALRSIRAGRPQQLLTGLLITLGLGLAFAFTQFLGWSVLVDQGVYFVGNPSGSFMYVITALHLAHLGGGLLYLLYVTVRAIRGRYTANRNIQVQLCAIYWHFLDILWIYLFVFLLVMR